MFVIHKSGNTFFLNDTKDVIDVCLSLNISDEEIGKVTRYLNNASFDTAYKSESISVLCVNDEKARRIAGFFGYEEEFRKQYGQTA